MENSEADGGVPEKQSTAASGGGADSNLSEDLALAMIKRPDVQSGDLETLGKNAGVMKNRKVRLAVVQHPRTPRHVALPLLRHLFTFELTRVTLEPVAPPDIKRAGEDALIRRLESISLGEKLTLARRASGRVAGELLRDAEPRVVHTALENSRLTEGAVVKAILRGDASAAFVQAASYHAKWSLRREVRIALLRNQHTPVARALEFARALPESLLAEILPGSSLPEKE